MAPYLKKRPRAGQMSPVQWGDQPMLSDRSGVNLCWGDADGLAVDLRHRLGRVAYALNVRSILRHVLWQGGIHGGISEHLRLAFQRDRINPFLGFEGHDDVRV